jgi:Holliday junction resolvase RusA-like endonuclease
MGWTKEQFLNHPKREQLLGKTVAAPPRQATSVVNDAPKPMHVIENEYMLFSVPGEIVGKPTMTKGDQWKKRPCVVRYRMYCDRLRAYAPKELWHVDVHTLEIIAHISVSPSWTNKKKVAMVGEIHREKPDWDNIGKAVSDALFEQDKRIACGQVKKVWCAEGEERTVVRAVFFPKSGSS